MLGLHDGAIKEDNGDVDGLALELGRMYRRDGLATDGFAEPERGKSIHGDSPTR